jgi:regulator of RNase E activity RraA
VSAFEASDQSLRLFCAEQDVAVSTFRHWRARLGQAATVNAAPPVPSPGARLVPVEVVDEPPAGSAVVVVPGGGVRIEVTAGFDGATLKRVLAILGAGA